MIYGQSLYGSGLYGGTEAPSIVGNNPMFISASDRLNALLLDPKYSYLIDYCSKDFENNDCSSLIRFGTSIRSDAFKLPSGGSRIIGPGIGTLYYNTLSGYGAFTILVARRRKWQTHKLLK